MMLKITGLLSAALILFLTALPAQGQQVSSAPTLGIPLQCDMGRDCFIQHYIDTDPSSAAADYRCGSLTYNNHRGTDFRVKTLRDMERGVAVIAAADGHVGNLRDGIADQYFSDYQEKKKKEIFQIGLGNVVILNHNKGWSTFYAHLKQGSLTVQKGQSVKKGDILGYVGMSGLTDFPHVHFELRYNNNKRIDPFSRLEKGTACGQSATGYWSKKARESLSYRPTGFMATGFSETRPKSRKDLESGQKPQTTLMGAAPTVFFWSYYIGARKGDRVSVEIFGPDGKTIAQNTGKSDEKNRISRYVYVGKKRPAGGWASGLYRGEITIERNGTLFTDSAVISIH